MFDGEEGTARQSSLASMHSVTSDIFDEADDKTDQRRSTLITTHDTNKTMLFQVDQNLPCYITMTLMLTFLQHF